MGGGKTPRTAPPQGGPSTSVGVELASGCARVFVHKRPEEQHWLLQCRWALHTGGQDAGDVAHLGSACISDAGAWPHPSTITSRQSLRCTAPLHGMLKKKKKEMWVAKVNAAFPRKLGQTRPGQKVTRRQSDTATARCSFNNWHNALPAALLRRTAVQLPARAGSCGGCGGYKYKLLTSATTVVCRSSSISNSLTALGSTLNAQGNKATFNK